MPRGRKLLVRKRKYSPSSGRITNDSITDRSLHGAGQTRISSRLSVSLQCQCGMIFYGQNRRSAMLQHCLDSKNSNNCKSMIEKCVHCNTDVLVIDGGYKQHIANSAYCKMKQKELERVHKVIGDYATTGVRIHQDTVKEKPECIETEDWKNETTSLKVRLGNSSKARLFSSGHPLKNNVSVIEENRETNLITCRSAIRRNKGADSIAEYEGDFSNDMDDETAFNDTCQFKQIVDSSSNKQSEEFRECMI